MWVVTWNISLLQDDKTALMLAEEQGHTSVVDLLIENGAIVDEQYKVCHCQLQVYNITGSKNNINKLVSHSLSLKN